jgi:hypothetical protein
VDRTAGRITFTAYVEQHRWPSRHLEVSTRAGYRSNLDAHLLPFFGAYPLATITPRWCRPGCAANSRPACGAQPGQDPHPAHGILARAVRDRLIALNPAEGADLPKVIIRRQRIISPAEFDQLLAAVPDRHRALILTGIETRDALG